MFHIVHLESSVALGNTACDDTEDHTHTPSPTNPIQSLPMLPDSAGEEGGRKRREEGEEEEEDRIQRTTVSQGPNLMECTVWTPQIGSRVLASRGLCDTVVTARWQHLRVAAQCQQHTTHTSTVIPVLMSITSLGFLDCSVSNFWQ